MHFQVTLESGLTYLWIFWEINYSERMETGFEKNLLRLYKPGGSHRDTFFVRLVWVFLLELINP